MSTHSTALSIICRHRSGGTADREGSNSICSARLAETEGESLAVAGQGRDDQLPALDVAYLKLVGLAARLGRRATEGEVRAFFAPYGEYAALAGCYALQRRFA